MFFVQHSWRLVPKQAGLLSNVDYETRSMNFEVKVVAHMQQDRQQDEDEKEFTNKFDLTFKVRRWLFLFHPEMLRYLLLPSACMHI